MAIFISYSKDDKKWLNRLRKFLDFVESEYGLYVWDDSKIQPGDEWQHEIHKAIASSHIVILLISQSFLSSRFIREEELPRLLERGLQKGARIFPIILSHCLFAQSPRLAKFQAYNAPERPLSSLTEDEQNQLFCQVAIDIQKELEQKKHSPSRAQKPIAADVYQWPLAPVESSFDWALAQVAVIWTLATKPQTGGYTITELQSQVGRSKRKQLVLVLNHLYEADMVEKKKAENRTTWQLSAKGEILGKEVKEYFTPQTD